MDKFSNKMKILKFRAYDKETKRMFPVFSFDCNHVVPDGKEYYEGKNPLPIPPERESCILMQFTGLHDSTKWEQLSKEEQDEWISNRKKPEDWNGKEIYEGDIVNIIEQGMWGGEYNVAVEYLERWALFGVVCSKAKSISHHPDVTTLFTRGFLTRNFGSCIALGELIKHPFQSFEIIGNIHENPELLEEK